MVTIRDVAKKANVHPSTVSRVLSGFNGISENTRDVVISTAKDLDFRPNAIARALSTQRTNTIGIVIPHVYEGFFNDNFFSQVMRGMMVESYVNDFKLIICGCENYIDEIKQIKQIMGSRQADGIIVMSSRLDVDTVEELINQKTPFVLIGHPIKQNSQDVSWVDANNNLATQQAIEHLIELGHRNIAYIGGDPENMTTQEREMAYRDTMGKFGLKINPKWIDYGYFDEPGGYVAVGRMKDLGADTPTAYYAANDLMAVGIMRALDELGIRVPEVVSVIGTNNSPASAYTSPPLTTVQVPYAKMASQAVKILINRIKGGKLGQDNHIVDCALVIRSSTAPAPSGVL